MNHRQFKLLLNVYPPYWGTGIVIKKVASDFREVIVQMKMKWYNRNYVNTHFGGSLYAMTDPFYMLMLIQILGREYIVWDKAATINFVKPGRGTVTAAFRINDDVISNIIRNTSNGAKYICDLRVDVKDREEETVCSVIKTVYFRKESGNQI